MQKPTSFQRLKLIILTILVVGGFGGCRSLFSHSVVVNEHYSTGQPVEFFLSPYFNHSSPYRLVMFVPNCKDNNYELQTVVAESIGRKLQERGTFQIVAATINGDFDSSQIASGSYDERELYGLAKQYGANGILFCETDEFLPYDPIGASVSLTLFDTQELVVTMYARGRWETSNPLVESKFRQHVCKKHRCESYSAGVFMRSPSEFFEFLAEDLCDNLSSKVNFR